MKRTLDSRVARGEEYYALAVAKAADRARAASPKVEPWDRMNQLDFKMLVAKLRDKHKGARA